MSQDGDLERDDEDVNLHHKSGFYGNSERKHRSSAFSSSLTWDSDSEKETFDGIFLHIYYVNVHTFAKDEVRDMFFACMYTVLGRLLAPFVKMSSIYKSKYTVNIGVSGDL